MKTNSKHAAICDADPEQWTDDVHEKIWTRTRYQYPQSYEHWSVIHISITSNAWRLADVHKFFQRNLRPNVNLTLGLPSWNPHRSLSLGKHVRAAIVFTWDHKSSRSFWANMRVWVESSAGTSVGTDPWFLLLVTRQPIQADEIQTFKALITVHKVLQEGHPIAIKEAQDHTNWLESLTRATSDDHSLRGTSLHSFSRYSITSLWTGS